LGLIGDSLLEDGKAPPVRAGRGETAL